MQHLQEEADVNKMSKNNGNTMMKDKDRVPLFALCLTQIAILFVPALTGTETRPEGYIYLTHRARG